MQKIFSHFQTFTQNILSHINDSRRFIFSSELTLPSQQQRMAAIQKRLRVLTWTLIFAIPLWSISDSLVFYEEKWQIILAYRLLASAILASFLLLGNAFARLNMRGLGAIYIQLGFIFAIPTLFYVLCYRMAGDPSATDLIANSVVHNYRLLPFVIVGSVGLFPLTIAEALSIIAPILLVCGETDYFSFLNGQANADANWILFLSAIIAAVTSHSQLRLLASLVDHTAYDVLTGCLGRRSGEEIVKALWHYSIRKKSNFSIAFIDLDHFKKVNDRFGHHEGDVVLSSVAGTIRNSLRKSDFVIRWGGEEFLAIMPDANIDDATNVLARIGAKSLATHPDGCQQTISVGIAERIADASADEKNLIQEADGRLYRAKNSGRARIIGSRTIAF